MQILSCHHTCFIPSDSGGENLQMLAVSDHFDHHEPKSMVVTQIIPAPVQICSQGPFHFLQKGSKNA